MGFESPMHWLVLAIIAGVLFFGWKQLPDMARSMGRSLRIFKTELKGMGEDDRAREAAAQQAPPAPLPSSPPAAPTVPPAQPQQHVTTPITKDGNQRAS